MKNEKLNLEQYLIFGGRVEKIDWSKSYCTYGDKNNLVEIVSFENRGDTNGNGAPLWYFTFKNGNTHRYALSWITLSATFVLHERYL